MFVDTIEAEGLAHLSYLIGDEAAGVAAVIDPRRDIEVYVERARERAVRITDVVETHIHADFVSGIRALAERVGARARGGARGDYGFELERLEEGDELELGPVRLRAVHTPGHTPEHVCLVASGGSAGDAVWGVFTGDTLFAGEVGRPDLLGQGTERGLAEQLFQSLRQKLLPLGDEVLVYPAHGRGSPCGGSIGDRLVTTLGFERLHNPRLRHADEERFVEDVLGSVSSPPRYYPRMKKINAAGPPGFPRAPVLPLEPEDALERQRQGALLLDTREIEAFGGAHAPGALSLALRSSFPVWAGRLLDPDRPIVLVMEDGAEADRARTHLARIGIDPVVGYVRRGMRGWVGAGLPIESTTLLSVHELKRRLGADDAPQVLDVRSEDEWQSGHVPGATHVELQQLEDRLDGDAPVRRDRPVAVYCGSGFRSSIAASILEREGFDHVMNVPGAYGAWTAAGYEVV